MIDRNFRGGSAQQKIPNAHILHNLTPFVRFERYSQWYPAAIPLTTSTTVSNAQQVSAPLSAPLQQSQHHTMTSNSSSDALCLLRFLAPNVRSGLIPTNVITCSDVNDSKSVTDHFLWENIMNYHIPVLLRDEDNRFVSKTMIELIIARNISSVFQLDTPMLAVKPTTAELSLLRKINEFHMAGQLTRIMSFDRWNDVLILFDDLINKLLINNKHASVSAFDSTSITNSEACSVKSIAAESSDAQNINGTGWIQINNVFLPFLQNSNNVSFNEQQQHSEFTFANITRGVFVPLDILLDCPLLSDRSVEQIIRSISIQASTQDLLLLNKRISDARLASESLKPGSRLVQVQDLMACVPRLYVRFLPVTNPKQYVSRRFSEASSIHGGILRSGHVFSPFIYCLPNVRCNYNDWIEIGQLSLDHIFVPASIWKSTANLRHLKPAELEYFELLSVYFSGLVKMVSNSDRLVSASVVANFDQRIYSQSVLFLEVFQLQQRDLIIKQLCKLPNIPKNVRSLQCNQFGAANNVNNLRMLQRDQTKLPLNKSVVPPVSEGNQQRKRNSDQLGVQTILLKNPSVRLCRDNLGNPSFECSNGNFCFAPLKVQGKKLLSIRTTSDEQKIPLAELQDMFFPELENSVVRVLCSQYLKRFTDEETEVLQRFKIDKENNYYILRDDIDHILRIVMLQRKSSNSTDIPQYNCCDEDSGNRRNVERSCQQKLQPVAPERNCSAGMLSSRLLHTSLRSSKRFPRTNQLTRRPSTLKRHAASDAERKIRMTLMCDNSSDDGDTSSCDRTLNQQTRYNSLYNSLSDSDDEDSRISIGEDKRRKGNRKTR